MTWLRRRPILDARSLLGNSAIYLLSNILNAAIPFFLLPVLTRHLTQEEYGTVGMFQMVLVMFGAFTGLSVQGAAIRKYYDKDEGLDLPAYVASCIQIVIIATSIVLVIVFWMQDELAKLTGISSHWLLMATLASGATYLCHILLGQWLVRRESLSYGVFQVAQSLLNMGLTLWLVVVMSGGLEGRLWGQSLPPLVFGITAIYLLYRANLLKFKWRPDYIWTALNFGIPLIPHIVGMFMLFMFDRAIIKHFLGLEQVGVFIVAAQLAMGMGIIADAINKAYVPWLYERLKENNPDVKKKIVLGTYGYFTAALIMALLVAIIATSFVPWFAGEEYAAASTVLGWLALGQAFNGMYMMVTNYIFYSQKTGRLSISTLLSGLTHLILVFLLVPEFGIEGAAIAYATSMSLRFLLTWAVAYHLHSMPWFSIWR